MTISISRRAFAASATLAAFSIATPSLRAQSKLEKSKVSIAIGAKASLYYLPLTIADQLGYFKAEGLEVEISEFPSGARAQQSLVGGSADVVSGAYEHTIHLQLRNQLVRSFVLLGRAPQIAMGVSIKTMPSYKAVADLKGKRIGVSSLGSSTHVAAYLVLARAGLKASDVNFVGVGTAAGALAAMRSGQIDAMCNIDPVMTMLEQKGEVKIIGDARTLKGAADVYGGAMPAACLYSQVDFIQKNPNTCQAMVNAIVHGLKWLQTAGPSDIIKTVPEAYMLGDRALYLASFNKVREAISLDGIMSDEGPRTALKALASFDASIKADKIALDRTYINDFARRAKEKFRA